MAAVNALKLTALRFRIVPHVISEVKQTRYVIVSGNRAISSYFGREKLVGRDESSMFLGGSSRCYGSDACATNKFDKTCIDPSLVANYDEIVDLPNHPEKLLIDVRQPEELAATGVIPTSINIPLKTVRDELKLDDGAFQAKYGRKKPTVNDPIIFSCRSGVRAGQAAFEADQLGFKNVKNYVGSWLEYAEKNGLPQ
ncbi:rhodanese domain-containing protein CG4456-like [Uranotaenia lowii]|uniref:rhodanese domain-containing protein CG4456-like n=1 Tax=Uranotaenia lowii TaxID=190385 RepID=UPI002478CF63|nr:rhodanese domain-containing protein CG4456-like [Uranotaenia lowii]